MKRAYKPSVNILCILLALEDAYMECEQDAQNVHTWLLGRNHKKAVTFKKGFGCWRWAVFFLGDLRYNNVRFLRGTVTAYHGA